MHRNFVFSAASKTIPIWNLIKSIYLIIIKKKKKEFYYNFITPTIESRLFESRPNPIVIIVITIFFFSFSFFLINDASYNPPNESIEIKFPKIASLEKLLELPPTLEHRPELDLSQIKGQPLKRSRSGAESLISRGFTTSRDEHNARPGRDNRSAVRIN